MSIIKNYQNEQDGLKIFLKNKQYQRLVTMMEDTETKKFVSQYMHDIEDAHVLLMLMKLYLEIENSHPKISVFEKVLIFDKVLKSRVDRHNIVKLFEQWKQNALLLS